MNAIARREFLRAAGWAPAGMATAGRLVLFPSYMWHGTTPITGDAPRLTIAFDAVPATR